MIGSSVNPALGRVDYSPITRGAESAAQSIQNAGQVTGQMYANLGKQISGGFEQYQQNKQKRDFAETTIKGRLDEVNQAILDFRKSPELYNNRSPISEQTLKRISLEDIPKMSIGKLEAYANELGSIVDNSRTALARANAVRQYQNEIRANLNEEALGKALMTTQGLTVQDGVSKSIKQDFRAPIEGLKALNYGEAARKREVFSGTSPSAASSVLSPSRRLVLSRITPPDYKAIPDNVKSFLIPNSVTGAAELNTDVVDKFRNDYSQILSKKDDLESSLKSGFRTDTRVESFGRSGEGGGAGFRVTPFERPMNPEEKIAAGILYDESSQKLAQIKETEKAFQEAQKIAKGDAMGATPVQIKTFIAKDPSLTPAQSSAFEYVATPKFRDATGAEKADKAISEYMKQGGVLGFDFLSKVKTAFKADVEMQDLGGGLSFVRVGNNVYFQDKAKPTTPSAALYNRADKQQYQKALTYAASFPTWESTPTDLKQFLAEAGANHGEIDPNFGRISANNAVAKRKAELANKVYSPTVNMLSPPTSSPASPLPNGFTATQPRR